MDGVVGRDVERAEVGDAVGPVGDRNRRPIAHGRPKPAACRVGPSATGRQSAEVIANVTATIITAITAGAWDAVERTSSS